MRGLEPPRCHHHRLLRPARLPVPPHPQDAGSVINANALEGVKKGLVTFYHAKTDRGRNHDPDRDSGGDELSDQSHDRGRGYGGYA